MHTDARDLEPGSLIEGDLCIVGAGAAGISMALEWIGAGRRVLLLEGGGFDYDPHMQDLYRGDNIGLPYYPIQSARLHFFGGTTGHWAGFCSTMDPLDFAVRDWVPHSGWPIARTELDPYYKRALSVVQIGPDEWTAEAWQRRDPSLVPFPLDRNVAWTKMWQFSAPARFGVLYRKPIVDAPDVHLYTHANVVEIISNENASAVQELRVRTLEGKEHRVRAKRFVLACCTIQNARLLLASNGQASAGLGNANDLVGRYFMEHLEMPSGNLVTLGRTPPSVQMYDWGWGRTKARGEIALSQEVQRRRRILNATVSLSPAALSDPPQSTFQQINPQLIEMFHTGKLSDDVLKTPPPSAVPRTFQLMTRQEQAPNPASRVTLSTERDALGMPRTRLDWRLTELDRSSFAAFYEELGCEFGRAGVGRLQMRDWVMQPPNAGWPPSLSGGWHHMGTTRMSPDPKQGVVDVNCRVHGIANLYVAGAAVFPTAGCVNPTFSLVALTLRLSDYLKHSSA
ncbi:MAG TPA: GMC family oxidoreductase [Gemmatimonadaceae bacterium]|jgi:choline dehydrogenase-like flavoprotein